MEWSGVEWSGVEWSGVEWSEWSESCVLVCLCARISVASYFPIFPNVSLSPLAPCTQAPIWVRLESDSRTRRLVQLQLHDKLAP